MEWCAAVVDDCVGQKNENISYIDVLLVFQTNVVATYAWIRTFYGLDAGTCQRVQQAMEQDGGSAGGTVVDGVLFL